MNTTLDYNTIIPYKADDIQLYCLSAKDFVVKRQEPECWYKIKEELYNLILLIDNTSNLAEISTNYQTRHNFHLPPEKIYQILNDKLGAFGFLNKGEVAPEYRKPRKRDYLYLRIKLISPDKISGFLGIFFPFFNKGVFYPLLLVSIGILAAYSIVFMQQMESILPTIRILDLLLIMLASYISVLFHEFGHAAACLFYGAKQKGIGFGFYLARPVFFADVTDAWKLSKDKRVIIDLAGMYFESVLCMLIIFVYFIYKQPVIQLFIISSFFRIILNLNPFLRYDGYWVLSDLANLPNLRKLSYEKISLVFKSIFNTKIQVRLKDILIAGYGFISVVMMGAFIYYIFIINPTGLIKAPKFIIQTIQELISGTSISLGTLDLINYLIVPLAFYTMLVQLLVKFIIDKFFSHVSKQ